MTEQSIPFLEFCWFLVAISLPVFLMGLASFACMLRWRKVSWFRVLTILPLWLLAAAFLTIVLCIAMTMADFNWHFKYDYLMIFTPALIATLITTIPAYWLSKHLMETTIKMDNAKPRSMDET